MAETEDLSKHLEFVQAVIARMAGNSFLLKGWTMTLSSAMFALAAKDANPLFAVIALGPAVAFWCLDAYYHWMERLYRHHFDELRSATDEQLRLMGAYSMDVRAYQDKVDSWRRTLFASPVAGLHGSLVVTIMLVIGYLMSRG